MTLESFIKKEFPQINTLKKDIIYLDSACSALKLLTGINAQKDLLYHYGACAGNRSTHYLSQKLWSLYEQARKSIAAFINSNPDEIVFTSGTTEAFNILASSFKFSKGDEIILSPVEHNSVFLPFYRIAKEKGVKLKIIPLNNYQPDFNSFKELITKKTKILCLSKASNFFGGIIDSDRFVEYAKKHNIFVFMDCAQYISSHRIDVKKLKSDAIAFSGHKIGAPYGTGVLYINSKLYQYLESSKVGGGTIKEIKKIGDKYVVEYLKDFHSFEAGISNYSGAYALYKCIERLNELGYENIRKKIKDLVNYTISQLTDIREIEIVGDRLLDGSIVSFKFKKDYLTIPDFLIFLSSSRPAIAIRGGKLCADLSSINSGIKSVCRISFFIYNREDDVNIFVNALKSYIKLAGN